MEPDHRRFREGPIQPPARRGPPAPPKWGWGELIIAAVIGAVIVLLSLYALGVFQAHPGGKTPPRPSQGHTEASQGGF